MQKAIWSRFGKNIDCVENIVSLCPNCHRAIHFGDEEVKKRMLETLFLLRKNELNGVGIPITLSEILSFYNIEVIKIMIKFVDFIKIDFPEKTKN